MAQDAVKDPLAVDVLVEPQGLEVVQGARGLRDGIAIGVLHIPRQRVAVIRRRMPQKGYEISSGRQPHASHHWVFCRVSELVDMALLERCSFRQQADRRTLG